MCNNLADPSRQPLVRGVIGAGATVAGAVLRDQRVDGRYFVSNDFYKTLLLMRAGAIGAQRGGPPAMPPPRRTKGGALREHEAPRMLTSSGTPPTRTTSSSSLTDRLEQIAESAARARDLPAAGRSRRPRHTST